MLEMIPLITLPSYFCLISMRWGGAVLAALARGAAFLRRRRQLGKNCLQIHVPPRDN